MSNIFDLFKKIETQRDTTPVSVIIAGLGNPGTQYEKTRHNVGFIAIDYIAEKLGVRIDRAKFHALVAEAKLGNVRVLLMKPQTYMNSSGTSISAAADFYKIPAENVIVLCDDITQKPGKIRKADILAACPDISISLIERTLKQMLDNGEIRKIGAYRTTAYIKI